MAIYCVVLGHLPVGEKLAGIISLFHMPCFFLISGYLAYASMNKTGFYRRLIVTKVKRLFIPFICWSGIAVLFNLFLSFITNETEKISVMELIWKVFFEARSVWFLIILFFTFIVWGTIRLLEMKLLYKFKHTLWLYIISWLLLCLILPNNLFQLYKFKFFLPYFGLVYFLHKYKLMIPIEKFKIILIANALLFILLLNLLKESKSMNLFSNFEIWKMNLSEVIMAIVLSIMGILFLYALALILNKTILRKIAIDFGVYSLDIYLIHMFFIKAIYWVPQSIEKSMNLYYYLYNPI